MSLFYVLIIYKIMPLPAYYLALGTVAVIAVVDLIIKNKNNIKERKSAYELLINNSTIQGFNQLSDYLQRDGFLTGGVFTPPEGVDNNTQLTIGAGAGQTHIKDVLTFLRNLTAGELRTIAEKAIKSTPQNDSIEDREQVLEWITQDIKQINNYDQLVKDLNNVNWVNKSPVIPPNYKMPLELRFSVGKNSITKVDYPFFVIHATSRDILDMTNKLLDPKDSTLEERQETYLQALEAQNANVDGFKQFVSMLDYNGFVKSPQQFNVPTDLPNTLTLGGSTINQATLISTFKEGSNKTISNMITTALNTYDPTLKDRIQALANLKSVMNNFKGEPNVHPNFPTVYNWLLNSGFTSSPRKYTPIPNLPDNFTAYSFGWYDIDNVEEWLKSVGAPEVGKLAEYATLHSIHFNKWASYKTATYTGSSAYGYLLNYIKGSPIMPPTAQGLAVIFTKLYNNGLMYSPPRITEDYTFGFSGMINTHTLPKNQIVTTADLNKSDSVIVDMWIGADPAGPLGIFMENDYTGKPNPNFNSYLYQIARNIYIKDKVEILLPS